MKPARGFLLGIVVGGICTGGIGYAATNTIQIDVTMPQVTYWYDGKRVNDEEMTNVPDTIAYQDVYYVPARSFAEGLGHEVTYDAATQEVNIYDVRDLAFDVIEAGEAPKELVGWVGQSKSLSMAQVREYAGDTYILMTRGKHITGGYRVEVQQLKQYSDKIELIAKYTNPERGMLMTTEVSYPYVLLRVEGTDLPPIEFHEAHGEPIPVLKGLTYLPAVVEARESVSLFEPQWGDGTVMISGAARTFAGQLSIALLDANGEPSQERKVQASAHAPDWGMFEAVFDWDERSDKLYLRVEVMDADEVYADELMQVVIDSPESVE